MGLCLAEFYSRGILYKSYLTAQELTFKRKEERFTSDKSACFKAVLRMDQFRNAIVCNALSLPLYCVEFQADFIIGEKLK